MSALQWVLIEILKAIILFLAEGAQAMGAAYLKKAQVKRENKKIREKVEGAKSDEDMQEALDSAARRLGRK